MSEPPLLDARDRRILGALMEKQVTVPATYPMTLAALRTACNQTSSRDPVSSYDEPAVEEGVRSLKDRRLLRVVWADRGPRTLKYHQLLTEVLALDEPEAALLTVLLLRGANAPGELLTRTERLHRFADRSVVEAQLAALAERGLVRELPRRPGQRDSRWTDLLQTDLPPRSEPATGTPAGTPQAAAVSDDRVREAYAELAEHSPGHRRLAPLDAWLLDRVAAAAGDRPVVDAGCGTGVAADHLHDRGARVRAIDLSPAMVDLARTAVPGVQVEVGDLRRLLRPVDADGWGAVVAWDALLHLTAEELPAAVAALARVLAADGVLALSLPVGAAGSPPPGPPDLPVTEHDRDVLLAAVRAAGLVEVEWYLRGALPGEGTDHLYLLARVPASADARR